MIEAGRRWCQRDTRLARWCQVLATTLIGGVACNGDTRDLDATVAEVTATVWAFHAADTARDAEAVIALLWPEFSIMADGRRQSRDDVVAGSRQFMSTLELFHTVWSDLRVTPLSRDLAIASFVFRDSIRVRDGTIIRARGPTTLIWQRRNGEWRVLFADADHYPIE